MKNKIAFICMGAGAALVFAALVLLLWNRKADSQAGRYTEKVLRGIVSSIENSDFGGIDDSGMAAVVMDGNEYVGYLTIPALELELPVMSGWDYERLKLSPCRYAGTAKTNDLVIAAHNYASHFGKIHELNPNDLVYFVDVDNRIFRYKVVLIDTISSYDVEKVVESDYALILFTCTYSGRGRVAVYCERD